MADLLSKGQNFIWTGPDYCPLIFLSPPKKFMFFVTDFCLIGDLFTFRMCPKYAVSRSPCIRCRRYIKYKSFLCSYFILFIYIAYNYIYIHIYIYIYIYIYGWSPLAPFTLTRLFLLLFPVYFCLPSPSIELHFPDYSVSFPRL